MKNIRTIIIIILINIYLRIVGVYKYVYCVGIIKKFGEKKGLVDTDSAQNIKDL